MATLSLRPNTGTARARILVVDDDVAILRTVGRYLRDYDVEVADSVASARDQLRELSFDLLLLDHRLPDGLGDEVVAGVRKRSASLPIIMMSGNFDPSQFHRGAHGGADDFIEKPFVREALVIKIERLLTAYQLRKQTAEQRTELEALHARHEREIDVARRIFDRMCARGEFDAGRVRQIVLPADRLAGDVVFGAHTGPSTYRWMIGDVTGHTLSSALVTLTLAGQFYGTAQRHVPLVELLGMMEQELVTMLPPNMFCVAAVCELDRRSGVLQVWNGGSPDVLIRRGDGTVTLIPSTSLPLAAERYAPPDHTIVAHDVAPGDRIYAFSDGLVELRDRAHEMIGFERLCAIARSGDAETVFDRLLDCIPDCTGSVGYDDDISLVEVIV